METPVIGGAIRSGADYRDGIAALSVASTVPTLPPSYQTEFDVVGQPLMQAGEPACVSHAWAELMKLWWLQKTGEVVDFSPRFLDILLAEPDIPLDGGRRPRTVAKISASMGCATTATVPNDTTLPIAAYRDASVITAAAKAEALKYKIPGFLQVPLDLATFRTYIKLYGGVSTLMQIGAEWYTPSWADSAIDPLRTPNPIIGGHQIIVKGWTGPVFDTLRNSWSAEWANEGEANFSHAAWQPYLLEGWTIAEIPADVKTFLSFMPSPANFHYQWNHNLAFGDDNDDVKFLQVSLMIAGFMAPVPAEQFGAYGPKTCAAVGKYQQSKGIYPAPESCGPLTRAALNAQFAISS